MSTGVRRAVPDDAAELLEMIRAHVLFEGGTATVSLAQLEALLRHREPPSQVWIAMSKSSPVGYAALTLDYALWSGALFSHLDCLFIRPEQRGNGLGTALVHAVADAARSGGAARLEWQTPVWNERAAAFYNRLGATGQEKRRFTLPLQDPHLSTEES